MKKYDLCGLTISLVILAVSYLTSNNLIIGLSIGLIFAAYYFLVARKKLKTAKESNAKVHECYNFIYSFLITLSVKESLEEAFSSATRNSSEGLNQFIAEMSDMSINDKIEYLTKYFKFSTYRMFTKVIALYVEQGGNVLKLSDSLIAENNRVEQTSLDNENISKKKTFEFIILWLLSFVVLVFMRFALNSFYLSMLSSKIFMILLIVFFIVVLLSIHIYILRYSKLIAKEESVSDE